MSASATLTDARNGDEPPHVVNIDSDGVVSGLNRDMICLPEWIEGLDVVDLARKQAIKRLVEDGVSVDERGGVGPNASCGDDVQ